MALARKVIPLQRLNGRWECAEDAINDIRMLMYGEDIKAMAESVGKSTACLYAIRGGHTKWPRGETLFTLLAYFDYQIKLVRM